MTKFQIEGAVKYTPKGNAIGLKVEVPPVGKQQYGTIFEVICFKGEHKGLEEGDQVVVTGELGSKKTEFLRDGKWPVYLTQLIARDVKKGGEFKPKAPIERARESQKDVLPPPEDDDIPF